MSEISQPEPHAKSPLSPYCPFVLVSINHILFWLCIHHGLYWHSKDKSGDVLYSSWKDKNQQWIDPTDLALELECYRCYVITTITDAVVTINPTCIVIMLITLSRNPNLHVSALENSPLSYIEKHFLNYLSCFGKWLLLSEEWNYINGSGESRHMIHFEHKNVWTPSKSLVWDWRAASK